MIIKYTVHKRERNLLPRQTCGECHLKGILPSIQIFKTNSNMLIQMINVNTTNHILNNEVSKC